MNSSLVALYLFTPSTRLLDSSGNEMDMMASPVPPTYQSDCLVYGDQCAVFDSHQWSSGTGNYFVLPSFNFGAMSQSDGFSICTWFTFDQFGSWSRIFDFSSTLVLCQWETSTTLGYSWIDGNYFLSPIPLQAGSWRHSCFVNRGYSWIMYENGRAAGGSTVSSLLSDSDLSQNFIGRSNYGTDSMLIGKVKDFRIYSKALSAGEVAEIYGIVSLMTLCFDTCTLHKLAFFQSSLFYDSD